MHCVKICGSGWADLNAGRNLRARRLRSVAGSINSGRHILESRCAERCANDAFSTSFRATLINAWVEGVWYQLGVISKFHTSRTNERTFIWEGGGLNPIRCAIDSEKKKLKKIKKNKKKQSRCRTCRVKSPKEVLRVVFRSPRQWVPTCERGQSIADVNCAFEGAGRHSLQFDIE